MNRKQVEALSLYSKINILEKDLLKLKYKLVNKLENLGTRYEGVVCGVNVVDLDDGIIYIETEDQYDCFNDEETYKEVDIEDYIKNVQN